MTSKIQQAKNERQLKELARLNENKRCAICTCMGTQFTCQPPGIFVCSTCAGAIYHFPGFRVKSRSMATYSTQEVQQMKEGGNAEFTAKYLARWNAHSFPAPTDKNPKKVEEFIKQVLVDKVFYSDTPSENASKHVNVSKTVLLQRESGRSLMVDDSIKALSEGPVPKQQPMGEWADFGSSPPPKPQILSQPFDPFAGSPTQASPKSVHSTPMDPFAPAVHVQPQLTGQPQPVAQTEPTAWDPFAEAATNGQTPMQPDRQGAPFVQPAAGVMMHQPVPSSQMTGWSQFESKSEPEKTEATVDGNKSKTPMLNPLPEEWFSVRATSPESHHTAPDVTPSVFQNAGPFGGNYVPTTPHSTYGYSPHARTALASFSSFRSARGGYPQTQQNFATLQQQDSTMSYVSHRVDETSHHPSFQNLDMDMRAKTNTMTGVHQPPQLFPNPALTASTFNPNGGMSFQPFVQNPPPTAFDESGGNPFA